MNELTVFKTSNLPEGQDYAWHADLNVVELSDRLDLDGRLAAVAALTSQWRRDHLSLVASA